jgi:hypothetical protein
VRYASASALYSYHIKPICCVGELHLCLQPERNISSSNVWIPFRRDLSMLYGACITSSKQYQNLPHANFVSRYYQIISGTIHSLATMYRVLRIVLSNSKLNRVQYSLRNLLKESNNSYILFTMCIMLRPSRTHFLHRCLVAKFRHATIYPSSYESERVFIITIIKERNPERRLKP